MKGGDESLKDSNQGHDTTKPLFQKALLLQLQSAAGGD